MTEKNDETRELTLDELDLDGALMWLGVCQGVAWSALARSASDPGDPRGQLRHERREVADVYYRSFPLMRALSELARENPGRTKELWARALVEPMPFGLPAVGMPSAPKEPAK